MKLTPRETSILVTLVHSAILKTKKEGHELDWAVDLNSIWKKFGENEILICENFKEDKDALQKS